MRGPKSPTKLTGNACLILLLSLVATLQGCGSGSGKFGIGGSASVDGAAIKKGTIIFMPTSENLPQTVGSIVDGRYDIRLIDGVLPGKYRVRITAFRGTGKFVNTGPLLGNENVAILEQYLPQKFNSKTKLTVAIEEDKRTYDFDLRFSSP